MRRTPQVGQLLMSSTQQQETQASLIDTSAFPKNREQWLQMVNEECAKNEAETHRATLQIEDLQKLALNPKIEDVLLTDIHRTIKNNNVVVADTFHAALSAYFDPFNLAHKAKSGAGKTYIPQEPSNTSPRKTS